MDWRRGLGRISTFTRALQAADSEEQSVMLFEEIASISHQHIGRATIDRQAGEVCERSCEALGGDQDGAGWLVLCQVRRARGHL